MTDWPIHILRFGVHAEQTFFTQGKDFYDWVLFNANTVHYFASGTGAFISGKLADKSYFIDPITHAFGHHPQYIKKPDSNEPKSSFAGLAEEYGEPARSNIGNRALNESDFTPDTVLEGFTKRVIDFQRDGLLRSLAPTDSKYMVGDPAEILRPKILVAPYFYMNSSNYKNWLPINLALIEAAQTFCEGYPLYGEIVIDRGILEDKNDYEAIIDAYLGANCKGFLLWIADFSEHEVPRQLLANYIDFIRNLSQDEREILNIYGGYFSIILTQLGLKGVTHGPGYGEERDVIPVGGGVPRAKFYLTPVHQRLLFETVEFMRLAGAWENAGDFYSKVCEGRWCKRVIGDDLSNFRKFGKVTISKDRHGIYRSYPTPDTRKNMIFHFLEAKAQEFSQMTTSSIGTIIEQLERAQSEYERYMPGGSLRYLGTWAKVLRDI